MKKFVLLAFVACVVTACETMDSFKSGVSNSYTKVSNLFTSGSVEETPCPRFVVSDELDNYYEIPGATAANQTNGLSNAKIERIIGNCRLNDNADIVTVSMDIDFTASAGEQNNLNQPENLNIPYFIAVLDENQNILAKDTFSVPLELSGIAADTYHKERLQQNIPLTEDRNPSTYTIITGFQLNEEQLAMVKTKEKLAAITPASGTSASSIKIPQRETVMVPVKAIKAPAPENVPASDPFAGR